MNETASRPDVSNLDALIAYRQRQADRGELDGERYTRGFIAAMGGGGGSRSGSAYDVERYNKALAQDLNDPRSAASWLLGGKFQSMQNAIVSGLSAGTAEGLAAAQQTYADLNDTVERNRGAFVQFSTHPGAQHGGTLELAQRYANMALGHQYNQLEVMLPDGSKTTVGQYFQNPGRFARFYSHGGFDRDAVEAYYGGEDAQLARALDPYMKGASLNAAGRQPNPNHLQDKAGARAVMDNWGALKRTFGDGAETFADRLHAEVADVGGYGKLVPSLVKYAEAKGESTGLEGVALASTVADDFRSVFRRVESAVASAMDRRGQGQPSAQDAAPARLSSDTRALLAASIAETLGIASASGETVDLSDPVKANAFIELDAVRREAYAKGYGAAFDGPATKRLYADHVLKAGTSERALSVIAQWHGVDGVPGVYARLGQALTGGGTGADGLPSSPALDALAKRIVDVVGYGYVLPRMTDRGMTAQAAVENVRADRQARRRLEGEVEEILRNFGVADPMQADVLKNVATTALLEGKPLNLLAVIKGRVDGNETINEEERRGWQRMLARTSPGNVWAAEYKSALAWLTSPDGGGLPEQEATFLLQRAMSETYESNNGFFGPAASPGTTLKAIMNSGYIYHATKETRPRYSADGTVETDSAGKTVEEPVYVRRFSRDLDADMTRFFGLQGIADPGQRRYAGILANRDAAETFNRQQRALVDAQKRYDAAMAVQAAKDAL